MVRGTERNALAIRRCHIDMSDMDILMRYMCIKDLPCKIRSPFRDNDKHPSLSLFMRDGRVYWKDFGTGEGGSVIDMLSYLWHVSYQEALLKIKYDLGQTIPSSTLVKRYNGKVKPTHGSEISIKRRVWKDYDDEFWNSFGISRQMLRHCNVFPISNIFFTRKDSRKTVCVSADKYAYAYVERKDGKVTYKIYQPFSKEMKWLSNHDKSVWDLWTQVFKYKKTHTECDSVIITSSRKDAMCIWENLGIPAMSLQGEGYIPKENVMKQVFDTFKNVYLWYDNDFSHTDGHNPGQDNARSLMEMYPRLKNICISSAYKAKDPSDLYRKYGNNVLKLIYDIQK